MSYVLDVNGYDLTETAQYDILHLQTQFLFGIFSLIFLVGAHSVYGEQAYYIRQI